MTHFCEITCTDGNCGCDFGHGEDVAEIAARMGRVAIDLLATYGELTNFALQFVDDLRSSAELFEVLSTHIAGQFDQIEQLVNGRIDFDSFFDETNRLTRELEGALIRDQLGSALSGAVKNMTLVYQVQEPGQFGQELGGAVDGGVILHNINEGALVAGIFEEIASVGLEVFISGSESQTLFVNEPSTIASLGDDADYLVQSTSSGTSNLFDGGGDNDTWGFRGNQNLLVDLRRGIASIESQNGAEEQIARFRDFEFIDTAIGDDTVIGNHLSNRFNLNGGEDCARAGGGRDIVDTGNGADCIIDGPGRDRSTGGGGPDTHRYWQSDRGNVITDFEPNRDTIDFRRWSGADDWSDLRDDQIRQVGTDVVIEDDRGNPFVRLLDILLRQLDQDDFMF